MKRNATRTATRLARTALMLFAVPALGGALTGLTGCGGSGSGSAAPARTGKLALTINWPAPSRLVPAGANSVDAVLSAGGTTLAHKLLVKPTAAPWTTTVTFDNLTPGAVTLNTVAYPNTDGSGVAQAKGSMSATIKAGAQTAVTVDMASTIDHLAITPASPTVAVGGAAQLTATAFDAQNNIVLTSAQTLTWSSAQSAVATVTTAGGVTGVAAGTSVITVTDSESGKSATTTLTVTGPLTASATGPLKTIVDRSGKFAYTLDGKSNSLSPFKINTDGTLTALGGGAIALAKAPYTVAMSPVSGSHVLYVDTADKNGGLLYQFNVNADGSLTPIGAGSIATQGDPIAMVIDPSGKYLYEVMHNFGIRSFLINADGSLTQNGPDFPDGGHQMFAAAIAPDGKALYVSSAQGGGIRIETINADGTLTNSGHVDDFSYGMTLDSVGKHLYLETDTGIKVYQIGADDSLTQVGTSLVVSNDMTDGVVTPDGKYFYTVSGLITSNLVWQFKINGDGSLTPLSPATAPAGTQHLGINITPDGKFVFLPNYLDGTISRYQVDANGTLTPLAGGDTPG